MECISINMDKNLNTSCQIFFSDVTELFETPIDFANCEPHNSFHNLLFFLFIIILLYT